MIKSINIINPILVLIMSLMIGHIGNAQKYVSGSEIKAISRVQKGRILLRWAPDKPAAWKLLNTYGYSIHRITVSRDGKTLINGERKLLNTEPLSPGSVEEWAEIAEVDDNAAIVAQAIFGASFSINQNSSTTSSFEQVIKKAEELRQRYSFALLIIDQDFKVAQKAGVGFIDEDVKANEKYLYQIRSNVPKEMYEIKDGGVFTGLEEYEPLPKPVDFIGAFKDQEVILSWNTEILKDYYNNYRIEKSTDSIHFFPIKERPYTITEQPVQDGKATLIDSISNFTSYYYRIKGISSFGETSPASKIISGEGKPALKINPYLTTQNLRENEVTLHWEFPEDKNAMITGFKLLRSDTNSGKFEVVLDNIPKKTRSVSYNNLKASNYFKIVALGKYGEERKSFAMLVQPEDNTPPAPPQGLTGVIDTLGVIRLSWQKNTEPDLLGYRVYRANNPNHEFSVITVSTIVENEFVDTVTIRNSNKKVYYRINALDQRANPSGFSEILELIKPDIVPPSPPVVKTVKQLDNKSIELSWTASPSNDILQYLVYRKEDNSKEWELVFDGAKGDRTYRDTTIKQGKLYSYTVLAKDQTGLESLPAPAASVLVRYIGMRPPVKGFYAAPNVEQQFITLSWRYNEAHVTQFEVYKGKEEEPIQLFRTLPAKTKVIQDAELSINTSYRYAIRAVFRDGGVSEKKELTIKY